MNWFGKKVQEIEMTAEEEFEFARGDVPKSHILRIK